MIRQNHIRILVITAIITVLAAGVVSAQQAPADIRQMLPAESLLVVGFDGRPTNPSIQAIAKVEDPQARELRATQEMALKKSVEDFATLYGVSLDFAKDVDCWVDQQWAVVLLTDEANQLQPVLMIVTTDPAAAEAALKKTLEPRQVADKVETESDKDYIISSYKATDESIETYAAVSGSVLAVSTSKTALKTALKGGGFAADSPGSKAINTLSGSMFYAYASSDIVSRLNKSFKTVLVSGVAAGVFVADNGITLRLLGYPKKAESQLLKQCFTDQPASARTVDQSVPATSLAAAAFPNIRSLTTIGTLLNIATRKGSQSPDLDVIAALDEAQVSAAITTVLPSPSELASAVAASDEAAKTKLAQIIDSLKKSGLTAKKEGDVTTFDISDHLQVQLAQQGRYIFAASNSYALSTAIATLKGERGALADSEAYKEVITALGNSNIFTLYMNLAPIQGMGYLAEGTGFSRLSPMFASCTKSLEAVESLGLGAGYDGDAINITAFLRAKPGITAGLSPASFTTAAAGAALFYPTVVQFCQEGLQEYWKTMCEEKATQLGYAMESYLEDNGKFPKRSTWRTEFEDYYYEGSYDCPTGKARFAFNKNLSGVDIKKIQNADELVVFFEASPKLANAAGSRKDAILPHDGCGYFIYADGRVEYLSEVPDQSEWTPKIIQPKKKAPAKKPSPSRKTHR